MTTIKLTREDVTSVLDELLLTHSKVSCTQICEALERRGFETMTGPCYRRVPSNTSFNAVWLTVCSSSAYARKISGNTRWVIRA